MKKLFSLVAVAGMVLGSAALASAATDVKVKGTFDFGFGLYDGTNYAKHDGEESFDALQRFRSQIDFIASESLKGVAYFEIGNINWGHGGGATWSSGSSAGRGTGGAMGADGVSVEVKNLYIDWLVPQTDLQVRMGIQAFAEPRAVTRADGEDGGYVLDDDLAGILLSYNFTDEVGVNLGWFRPWDPYINDDFKGYSPNNSDFRNHDEIDVFFLSVPIEFKDQFSITPWGIFANVGQNDSDGNEISSVLAAYDGDLGDKGHAWWAGVAFDLSYFDPFVADIDFAYGGYDADRVDGRDMDRSGWVAIAKFGYKLDYFTPNIFGWYGSGSDDYDKDGRDGIMPSLSSDWGLTSFGWSNAHFGGREYQIGSNPAGTWAIGAGLDDIKFIDDLTSQLRFAYFRGTNDLNDGEAFISDGILGEDDYGFEVNLDNVYNIYDNLDLYVELGYINLQLDNEPDDFEDNVFKGYVGFKYSF